MGVLRTLITGRPDPVFEAASTAGGTPGTTTFAVDQDSIPAQVFGLQAYADTLSPAPRIDRRTAIQCPAVKRSRDLICGPLGGLPLRLYAADNAESRSSLLDQPEPDLAVMISMTRLVEDLLFEGVGWWRVLATDWRGYPSSVRRLEPRTVNVTTEGKVYLSRSGRTQGSAVEWLTDAELIRFDSPNDPLLVAGARAIRTALLLDAAAANAADGVPPLDYFTPAEDVDLDDDVAKAALDDWRQARRDRTTGYVPAALKYNSAGFNPDQIQMTEARNHAVLEIARTAGVDPEELGVSTTSRTYANTFDRRKSFTDFTLGSYMKAIEGRLSMADVTPRGFTVRFDLDDFLRSDPKSRYEAYAAGKAVGALTQEDILRAEGKPLTALPNEPAPVVPTTPVQEATA